jgi:peroxiredoxin
MLLTLKLLSLSKRQKFYPFDGQIEKVFYPVFPPEQNAEEVIEWLSRN